MPCATAVATAADTIGAASAHVGDFVTPAFLNARYTTPTANAAGSRLAAIMAMLPLPETLMMMPRTAR